MVRLMFPAGRGGRPPGPGRPGLGQPGADQPGLGRTGADRPGPDQPGPWADPYRPGRRAPGGYRDRPPRRPRRIPLSVKWTAAAVLSGLIFRRAIASVVLTALSTALHVLGIGVHLPSVQFGWPWQGVTSGTTRNTDLGPWVLQKIEGISRPALGQATFNFVFTHKVTKSLGIWPCWYASTFYAVGHASATVDLNPGPSWWGPGTGHYRLRVLKAPAAGVPGLVAVTMTLPPPQLPRSAHDVVIDNIPSRPLASQHSWTYPGLGCGAILRPQFPESVLYAQAQQIAFYKAAHSATITRPLIASAETQASRTIRDNFIQPTVNAFGYRLASFSIHWAAR
jgi:hypothetical protein